MMLPPGSGIGLIGIVDPVAVRTHTTGCPQ
jgi:hypothetical protein